MATAYIMIKCEIGSEHSIINNLKTIDGVKEVHGTFGAFDIIIKVESNTEDNLIEIISKRIRMVPKIRATLTLMTHEKNSLFAKKLNSDEKETFNRYASQAYIAIHCKKTQESEVLRDLSDIPEVIEGYIVLGSYDLICKVVAPTYNDISHVVTKKIRKTKDVRTTITLNVIP